MQDVFLKLFVKMQCLKDALMQDESGQDIVEYAVVVGLIAMAATATLKTFATSISTAFSNVGSKMNYYTT